MCRSSYGHPLKSALGITLIGSPPSDLFLGESDLLTVYNAYCAWRHVCVSKGMPEQQFCRKNYLSQQTLSNIEDLKAQLTGSLAEAGFIDLAGAERAALHR